MGTHNLKKFEQYNDLSTWYDEKYTEMGGGWDCPKEVALKYLSFMDIPSDNVYSLLDVGCGCGSFVDIARHQLACTAIDISSISIKIAKEKVPNVKFFVDNMETFDITTTFDYITSIGSLEHAINIEAALKNIKGLLKYTGFFYVLVPNEAWQYFDQPNEITHTDKEWSDIFISSGFQIVKLERIGDLTQFLLSK